MLAGQEPTAFYIELTDAGCISATCSNGHDIMSSIQNFDFDLLFDLAGMALLDGYSREAVGTFATAVERARETYVRCNFHPDHKPNPLFETTWKEVRRQSERQLGAFLFTWLANEKSEARSFSQREVELRNNCVHYGTIPTFQEALAFGQSALEMIEAIHTALTSEDPEKLGREVFRRTMRGRAGESLKAGRQVSTQCLPTMIAPWNAGRDPIRSLSDRLPELAKYRQWLWRRPDTLGGTAARSI